MHELKETDREAILLRYFENRQFAEVGVKLGLNENAARMRVERALEKLRAIFAKRGITTAAALASVISANAVQLAPANLAVTLTTASIATAGTGTFTLMKMLTMTNLKLGIGALAVAGATTAVVVQHHTQAKLNAENQSLQQQITQLQSDNASLSNRFAAVNDSKRLTDEQFNELLRLRDEVTRLQSDSAQLAQLKTAKAQQEPLSVDAAIKILLDRVAMLKERLNQMPNERIPELRFLTQENWLHAAELSDLKTDDDFLNAFSDLRASAKFTFGGVMHLALFKYARSNDGMLPTNILELQSYLDLPVMVSALPILRRYELLVNRNTKYVINSDGSLSDPATAFSPVTRERRPSEEPLILEKAPVNEKYDTRLEVAIGWYGPLDLKYYSYTNGIPPVNGSNSPSTR